MRHLLISCALCAMALPATAEDSFFRCIDGQGVVMLTDRPCESLPNGARSVMEKEHFVLPASEQARSRWVNKPPAQVPPKIDVQTLRMARQALDLRDKVASAR
ncbi:protein of unknown function [Duganella sp. CF458]|uniref:DUF4124 domain-containing protein n=1 Tax=Duganella sp. CF458 TaxID=1884368 RepID=UPI0008E230B8|nr:DUF4124 domain-containing protein [Duganella sp. CF458]SFG89197.1 protein of unknown function [Duganella sp. CF458]